MAQRLPRLRGFGTRAVPTSHPDSWASRAHPCARPLRALAQSLAELGCAIRGLNTFPLCMSVKWNDGFFRVPVARAEYRSPSGSFQASPCLSRAALFAADELASARSGEERKEGVARSGVSFSLVTFSWTSKRKSPWVGGGASQIQTRGRRPLHQRLSLETP